MRIAVFVLVGFATVGCKPRPEPIPSACAGPPLRSVEKREAAMQAGYEVLPGLDCISQRSLAAQAPKPQPAAPAAAQAPATLAEARQGFVTRVSTAAGKVFPNGPLPSPPPSLYVRTDYRSGDLTLAAFVTPEPRDGRKHPAIIWMTGGDTNSLSDFWQSGSPNRSRRFATRAW